MNTWDWADGDAASLQFRREKELEADGDPEGAPRRRSATLRLISLVQIPHLGLVSPAFGPMCAVEGAGGQVDRGLSLV